MYEQQRPDGSFHLAVVGTADKHCGAAVQSLGLRLVSEGAFDEAGWDSIVVGA
ncbi:MAG: hypothetical protein K0M70_01630 [Arenimonas sp.]|uniref:hypothetical protein n=1 Tax=Arenimonas sp. TaxID=1872635 RepID=UPI0025C564D7|nr:hypothetical protein [Arenimonas sp.]MBW8366548.1 hypothetical protein [Arenimonas sp.]